MNELNQLEKQLESWIPRRPSATLKHRLFRASAVTPATPSEARAPGIPLWLMAAPAACILLITMLLGEGRHQKQGYLAISGGSNVLASLSSNLLTYCATDMRAQHQNVWTAVTFEWTKGGNSPSTTGSFLSGKTNLQKL
jgi:hypothetical protein